MDEWVASQKEELRSDVLKLVLYELNTSISPRAKRMAALYAALDEFNHNDPSKHDQELDLHADKILLQKLAYCYSINKNDEELGLLACAMERIYSASRSRVAISFHEIGDSLVPLLVEMIRCSSSRKMFLLTKEREEEKLLKKQQVELESVSIYNGNGNENGHGNGHNHSNGNGVGNKLRSVEEHVPSMSSEVSEVTGFSVDFKEVQISPPSSPKKKGNNDDDEDEPLGGSQGPYEGSNASSESSPTEVTKTPTPPSLTLEAERAESASYSRQLHGEENHLDREQPQAPKQRQVRFSDSLESLLIVRTDEIVSTVEKPIRVKKTDTTNPVAVRRVLKVIRYFSRVLSAMIPLCHHPGLLDELVFQLRVTTKSNVLDSTSVNDMSSHAESDANSFFSAHSGGSSGGSSVVSGGSIYEDAQSIYSNSDNSRDGRQLRRNTSTSSRHNRSSNGSISGNSNNNSSISNAEIQMRIDAIATVVNLACAEENKSKLLYHPGLLDAVMCIAEEDFIDEAREHASIVIMNLALEESNKVYMANQDALLHAAIKLLNDNVTNTRRYASAIILSLACAPDNTLRIATFCEGKILSALAMTLLDEQIEEIRINVAETLFNLARCSTTSDTIEMMGEHMDVLPALSTSVLSDYSADVRAYSARTLEWLAADIHYDSKCHEELLTALTEASMWTKTTCIAEAFKSQAAIMENRKVMVEHRGVLDTLATLASLNGVNDQEVRECALVAIERLAHEPSTRRIMAEHQAIMTELTRATFSSSGILDEREEVDGQCRFLMKSALKYLAESL